MAKIKVIVDPAQQSEELTKDEIMALANANTPPEVVPSADVIRDSNGKLIQVNVNLPDTVDAPGLEVARAAIEANNGVSKASSSKISLINETFTSLTEGQTGFTLGEFQSVGAIEGTKHYDDAKGASFDPSGSVGAVRFTQTGSAITGENVCNGGMASLNISASSSQYTVAYDSLEVDLNVFFEAPYEEGNQGTNHLGRSGHSLEALDPYDVYNEGEDKLTINLGKIHIEFEAQGGLNTGPGSDTDGQHLIKCSIGGSAEQSITVSQMMDKWVEIHGEYNGQTGTGSITITVDGSPTTMSFTGLTGLVISTRSSNEFQFIGSWNPHNPSTGDAQDGIYNANRYIDGLSIQITNTVGV